MNILEKIVIQKKKEIQQKKEIYPIKYWENQLFFEGKPVSMKKYLLRKDKSGIIAEFKRKSPSKGIINEDVDVEKVTIGYMQAGASGLSILTDTAFFGGYAKDLEEARKFNFCPILRKDFILDKYQIYESKALGADTILLIARLLTKEEIKELTCCVKALDMETILEIHNEEDLDKMNEEIDIIGVNNRNLENFSTHISLSLQLADKIPNSFIKISESGIDSVAKLKKLKNAGYDGFLMGENFMKTTDPPQSLRLFVKEWNKTKNEN